MRQYTSLKWPQISKVNHTDHLKAQKLTWSVIKSKSYRSLKGTETHMILHQKQCFKNTWGRNQIQSCSSPFLTKNPFIQLNWVQSQRILIIHNSISDFLHLLLKNTYLTFLRSSSFCFFFLRWVTFLVDKSVKDGIRSYLTSNTPGCNNNTILNIDNSKDISILIKPTSLSHFQ